jgi:diguanylate cyclase
LHAWSQANPERSEAAKELKQNTPFGSSEPATQRDGSIAARSRSQRTGELIACGSVQRFTLQFGDPETEREFDAYTLPRTQMRGKIATFMGAALFGLFGFFDPIYANVADVPRIWAIRAAVVLSVCVLGAYSYSAHFKRHQHAVWIAIPVLASSFQFLITWGYPERSSIYAVAGMILIAFYSSTFLGTRFRHSVWINVATVLIHNLLCGIVRGFSAQLMWTHNIFLWSAVLVTGTSSYFAERQDRTLFSVQRELERERADLQVRALHDPLTGLPNRDLLMDRLERVCALARRESLLGAAFFIDLDDFKPVNDTYGHEVGDLTLRVVGQRLRAVLRDSDTVARLGGDEFFAVAHRIAAAENAQHIAEKIARALREPMLVGNQQIRIGCSIGICLFPYPESTPADVVRRADAALYLVKRGNKGGYAFAEQPAPSFPPEKPQSIRP